ncbi:MAG: cysteine peptidase family C39 domain-containing protein, partial [Candidatus Omnitrophica bacterium]|nr:cysteine peptidase family C39 domain-containing protein [Candidatus Omnitrophota bacterium]
MFNPKPRTEDQTKQPETKPKFKSSFKAWIRVVAFIVIAVFLPEQAAQAVEYDWRVLWNKPAAGSLGNTFTPNYLQNIRNIDTAVAIRNILKDIANKPITAIKISSNLTVELEKPLKMSNQRIDEIFEWLKGRPCGSKALYDYLTYTKGLSPKGTVPEVQEQDIAIMALTIDILNDVVKPEGNPEVIKTSLYALSKASEFFGSKLYPVKLDTSILNSQFSILPVPFIAHVNGDHYVLVTRIADDKVYFSDNHKEEFLPKAKFQEEFTGFALVSNSPAGMLLSAQESKKILGAGRPFSFDPNSAASKRGRTAGTAARTKYQDALSAEIHKAYLQTQQGLFLTVGITVASAAIGSFGSYVFNNPWISAAVGAGAGYVYNGIANDDWTSWDSLKYAGAGAAAGYAASYLYTTVLPYVKTTDLYKNAISPTTWTSYGTWTLAGGVGGYVYNGIANDDWWSSDSLKYAGAGA